MSYGNSSWIRVLLLTVIVAAVLLLSACGGSSPSDVRSGEQPPSNAGDTGRTPGDSSSDDAPSGNANQSVTHPKVTIASVSNSWTVVTVPYVAMDKGFFEEFGLKDIEYKIVGPATTHVSAFVGGSIDFSVNLSTDTLLRANAGGGEVFAIAGSTNGNSYVLYGGKGITSIQDLKGKLAATDAPGGTGELLTADIIRAGGLEPGKDVQYVPVSGTLTERVQAMLSGTTQAALGTISDYPMLKEQGVTILGRASDIYPDYQFAVLGASGNMVDNYPETVTAYLKGMIKAWQFLSDPSNDAEVLSILKARDVPVDESLWPELIAIQREFWPVKDGSPNVKGIEVVLEREIEVGRVPADYTVDRLLRLDPLEKAQRELGLVQ